MEPPADRTETDFQTPEVLAAQAELRLTKLMEGRRPGDPEVVALKDFESQITASQRFTDAEEAVIRAKAEAARDIPAGEEVPNDNKVHAQALMDQANLRIVAVEMRIDQNRGTVPGYSASFDEISSILHSVPPEKSDEIGRIAKKVFAATAPSTRNQARAGI